jgi:hypothetical protein
VLDPDWAPRGDLLQWHFLYRAAMQRRGESGVLHDVAVAVADVYPVMRVTPARCYEVRAYRQIRIRNETPRCG